METRKPKIKMGTYKHQKKEKTIMAFGKFEGEYLEDIPIEYLQWLVNQPRFREEHRNLSKEIDALIEDTDKNFYESRFEDETYN